MGCTTLDSKPILVTHGYTPRNLTCPRKKGTWNTVHLPTIDFNCFFSKHVPFQRSRSIFEAFFALQAIFFWFLLNFTIQPRLFWVVSSRFTHQLHGSKPGCEITFICQWNLCISKAIYGCFLKWWYTPKHPKMIIFSGKTHGCWVPPKPPYRQLMVNCCFGARCFEIPPGSPLWKGLLLKGTP